MDYDLALDSNYVVNPPVLGENKFGKESADGRDLLEIMALMISANSSLISSKNITVAAALSKPFKF